MTPSKPASELTEKLKAAADEMRAEDQPGWPVLIDYTVEHIDRLLAENATKDAEIASLRARLAEVERERDYFRKEAGAHFAESCKLADRALTAEAALAEATKVIEPFARAVKRDATCISGWRFGVTPKPEDFYAAATFRSRHGGDNA